ncbi:hypothetical protein MUP46_04625, partial [Patescibacteria group bacterium]|nr:hypothetical protein [Patescibacteria group bacterium]
MKRLPIQLGATILQAVQGINGPSVVDRDWADRYIADANTDINRFVEEIRWQYPGANALQEVSRLSQNLAYSLTSMGTGTLAALPLWLTPEFTGATKAAAAVITGTISGIVAYRMTTYQIVQQYLEFKDAEKRQQTGQGLTLEEEKQLKTDFNSKAVRYGLWEAVPEGVGNMLFSGILTGAFTNALVKVVGQTAAKQIATSMGATIATKATSIYGEELLTEMITQKGQSDIEVEAGLREGRISWWQALKEIAPQTFLLTTLMAGAGQTVISSTNAIKKAKTSLKNEIGEEHSLYTIISDGIESEFG